MNDLDVVLRTLRVFMLRDSGPVEGVRMKKINSRNKGAAGERELAGVLRSYGVEARRGQQFSGSAESPDVVTGLSSIHFECKRVEAGSLYSWMDQAMRDAGTKTPVVAHRRNKKQWVVILNLDDFLNFILMPGAYHDKN